MSWPSGSFILSCASHILQLKYYPSQRLALHKKSLALGKDDPAKMNITDSGVTSKNEPGPTQMLRPPPPNTDDDKKTLNRGEAAKFSLFFQEVEKRNCYATDHRSRDLFFFLKSRPLFFRIAILREHQLTGVVTRGLF